jgi:3-oxoacyl-(acyl-carrier-protein) synthase III
MYVPEGRLTNQDFERMVDTSDEWIRERTGIIERRIAAPDQASSDLALEACKRALEMARLTAQDVDQIILATTTPDRYLPSCACTVQQKLGATRAAAYDVFAACSGFIYGLGLGRSVIGSGMADTVLVVGVETLTRIVDFTDATCVFRDGAGAVVLAPAGRGELCSRVEIRATAWATSRSRPAAQAARQRGHGARAQTFHQHAAKALPGGATMEEPGIALTRRTLAVRSRLVILSANQRIIDALRGAWVSEEAVRTSRARQHLAGFDSDQPGRGSEGTVSPATAGLCVFGVGTMGAAVVQWSLARVTPKRPRWHRHAPGGRKGPASSRSCSPPRRRHGRAAEASEAMAFEAADKALGIPLSRSAGRGCSGSPSR